MLLYELVAQNRELFRLFYSLIIVFICLIIVLRTNKLFKLSYHEGIRYFRNAFFFYGLAFATRYFLIFVSSPFLRIVFEFFLVMAGFFLIYSLLWKRIEGKKPSESSLINTKIFIFYAFALIISFLDYLWNHYYFMFFSQIFIFILAVIISYENFKKSRDRNTFLRFYFIAMVFSLAAWILNFIACYFFNWRLRWVVGVYVLNIIVFVLFLYGVVRVIKKQDKKGN